MENWKYFHESKRYNWYVSNQGRVRKVSKTTDYDRIVELSLSGGHVNSRYYCFALNDMPEKYLHRLVAKMFIDNPENKRTVNHIDGNKLNNHVDNLEWATYKENMDHAFDTGLRRRSFESKHVTELKAEVVNLRDSGFSYRKIAETLGISGQYANITYRRAKGLSK